MLKPLFSSFCQKASGNLLKDTHLHQVQALDAVLHFFDKFDFICRFQLCQLDGEVSLFLLGWRCLLLLGCLLSQE